MRIAIGLVVLLAACTAPAPDDRLVPPLPPPSTSSSAVQQVPCEDYIESLPAPPTDREVILDTVALPTSGILTGSLSDGQLFAKNGLVVRANTTVDLIVSGEDLGHATISWGNGTLAKVSHLQVPKCAANAAWIVFPGGYTVDGPRCLTLVVRTGGRQATARVGISQPC